jgi:hypothetical protein
LFKGFKNRYNRYPKRFHFDGGKEVNTPLQKWLKSKGIDFTISSPYIHEQNGLAKRSIRVLLDRLRATITGIGIPYYLWCFILPTIVDIVNRTAVTNRDLTPYQSFLDDLEPSITHKPNLSQYRAIRSLYKVYIPTKKRPKAYKLAPQTKSGKLLAILGIKTYIVYIPSRHAIV